MSQALFSFTAGMSARTSGHVIRRFTAKIDQITAESAKGIEKLGIFQRRESLYECLPDGPVESGIRLVEKSTGSRRRFTDEKDAYPIRAVLLSKQLAVDRPACLALDETQRA
ncbi:MAG TPA: hypothetical protein VEK33_15170 [Terriglobales bacterium]|nr:hypothetical protein [Terriglobales bacterium]